MGCWKPITPKLCSLHCHPAEHQDKFKVLVLVLGFTMLDGSGPSCPREHLLQSRPLMTAAFHGNNGIVGKMGNEWGRQTASAVRPQLRDAFLERIRTPVNLAVLGIKREIHLLPSRRSTLTRKKKKSLGRAQGWSQFLFKKDSDYNNVYGSIEKIVYIFFLLFLCSC